MKQSLFDRYQCNRCGKKGYFIPLLIHAAMRHGRVKNEPEEPEAI